MKKVHAHIFSKIITIISFTVFFCEMGMPYAHGGGGGLYELRSLETCKRGTLAKDSFFKEIKEKTKDQLNDSDIGLIMEIVSSISGASQTGMAKIGDAGKLTSSFVSKLDPRKTKIRDVRLARFPVMINRNGQQVIVPCVSILLRDGSEMHYYLLYDATAYSQDQLDAAGISYVLSVNDLKIRDIGFTWRVPTVMEQTVENPTRKAISPKVVQETFGIILKKTPFYWKKSHFKQLGLETPSYLSAEKGWESFIYDLSTRAESKVSNAKYTLSGLENLQVKFYTVDIPLSRRGILFEDGSRRLAYSHLNLLKNDAGEIRGELEIYLPSFLFDEKTVQALFAEYKISSVSTAHILAQLIDREIGVEFFGIPSTWMDVEKSRLNSHDFIAISEADLLSLFLARKAADETYLKTAERSIPAEYPMEIQIGLNMLAAENKYLWSGKILFPTTTVPRIDWEKELKKAEENKEIAADPLFAEIKELAKLIPLNDRNTYKTLNAVGHKILTRAEEEFKDSNFTGDLAEIRKYAHECALALRKQKYEEAVLNWGRLRNRIAWLKSPYNLKKDVRAAVQKSKSFKLLDLFGKYADYYFSRFIEINGLSCLESIVDREYVVSGQVRIVRDDEEFKQMCKDAKPWEIMVIDYMPDAMRAMQRVAGIITGNVGALQSHEATRARAMGIPGAAVFHASKLLGRLDGKWVTFTVNPKTAKIEPFTDPHRIAEAIAKSQIERPKAPVSIPMPNLQTKSNYLTGFDSFSKPASVKEVGSKAYNLARLKKNLKYKGVEIPEGDAIPFAAYARFLEKNPELAKFIQETEGSIDRYDVDDVAAKLAMIRQRIIDTPMPPDIEKEILDGLAKGVFKEGKPVAVRSSMNAEDRNDLAAAGYYDSYLNVKTPEEIVKSIKKVWASIWNANPYYDRLDNGIKHNSVYPAVLIQEMVPAEASLVVFTADLKAEKGKRINYVVMELVRGLGESLVGAQKEYGDGKPTTVKYDKKSDKVGAPVYGTKAKKVVTNEFGGTELVDETPITPDDLKKIFGDPFDASFETIGRVARAVEEIFEIPQDIELTIVRRDGEMKICIVQSRPISGMDYYPVTKEKVAQKYGNLVEEVFNEYEPLIQKPYNIDDAFMMSDGPLCKALGDMIGDPERERYVVPLMTYVYKWRATGPKLLAYHIMSLSAGHLPIIKQMMQLPPPIVARIMTFMATDLTRMSDELMGFDETNKRMIGYFFTKSDPEVAFHVLRNIRDPKILAFIVARITAAYKDISRDVSDEIKGDMKDKIYTVLGKYMTDSQVRIFWETLSSYADFLEGDIESLKAFRKALTLNRLSDNLILKKLGVTVDTIDQVQRPALVAALNDMLKVPESEFYDLMDAKTKDSLPEEVKRMVLERKAQKVPLTQRELMRLNKSLLDVVYEDQIRKDIFLTAARKWLKTIPTGVTTQIQQARTLVISDNIEDTDKIVDHFARRGLDETVPMTSLDVDAQDMQAVKDAVLAGAGKLGVVILNMKSWQKGVAEEQPLLKFLYWLQNESGITVKPKIILILPNEVPEGLYREFNVYETVVHSDDAVRDVLNTLIRAVSDIVAEFNIGSQPAASDLDKTVDDLDAATRKTENNS